MAEVFSQKKWFAGAIKVIDLLSIKEMPKLMTLQILRFIYKVSGKIITVILKNILRVNVQCQ